MYLFNRDLYKGFLRSHTYVKNTSLVQDDIVRSCIITVC